MSAARALGLPLRLRGIQLGRAADVLLDGARRRVVGFSIVCGDDERRFVPLAVTTVRERDLEVPSPLVLLEPAELAFYAKAGSTFAALRGAAVVDGRMEVGALEDILFELDGSIACLDVVTPDGPRRLAFHERVSLAPSPRAVRAAS